MTSSAGKTLLGELSFCKLLARYGVRRIVTSVDFLSALLVGIVVLVWGTATPEMLRQLEASVLGHLVQASASMLGIVVAGFAILGTVSDRELAYQQYKLGTLATLLFPFWLVSGCWMATLIVGLIHVGLSSMEMLPFPLARVMLSLVVFAFVFGAVATVRLVGTILKVAYLRAAAHPKLSHPPKSDGD